MTQPLGKNYGGMMQAFALQKILKNMGHDVVTIDYNNPQPTLFYVYAKYLYRFYKKIIGRQKKPINIESHAEYIFQNSNSFINKYISQSEYIDNEKNLKNNFDNNKYDVVIVGSDQTWRPKYSPNIYNYYLDFLVDKKNIKKLAYASSFGVDAWEYSKAETKKCAELVASFDAVSVREKSGIILCEEYLDIKSTCVLDPTLLIDKKEYIEIIGHRYNKSEGVLTYFLDGNKDKLYMAEYLSKKLCTHTYSCQARKDSTDLKSYTVDDYVMPAVEDWLASFSNASFVLTDSFHGMVFSIIFEKPFLVIVNKERGAARFESLLSQLGGEERLVYDPSNIDENINEMKYMKPLDKKRLLVLKRESIDFLIGNLDGSH